MSVKHEPRTFDDGTACSCGKSWPHEIAEVTSVGLWRTPDHRYYWQEPGQPLVGPLTSVTTAMKAVDKSGPLIGWAKKATAECAIRNLPMLGTMVQSGGTQAAVDWLKRIPDYQRDSSADLGTRVHILAEKVAYGGTPEMTDEEAPFVASYRKFLADFRPDVLRVEAMICNLTHGYAGTLDLLARLPGLGVGLIDLKSGSGVYSETALQLSALGNGEFMGWPGDPRRHPMPHIDFYAALHLRPEGYRLVPFAVDNDTFWRFLEAKGLWEWLQGQAKTVMGAPLAAPIVEEVAA